MPRTRMVQSEPQVFPGDLNQANQTSPVPLPQTVFSGGTDPSAASSNLFNNAVGYVALLNQKLQAQFDAAVESYNAMAQSGSFPKLGPPPVAPKSWQVVPGAPGSAGPSYDQTGPPLMPTIPIYKGNNALISNDLTQTMEENVIDIGAHDYGAFYNSGQNDTWPDNKQTPTQPDGHVYIKIPAPVGSHEITWPDGTVGDHGGWYEQIS